MNIRFLHFCLYQGTFYCNTGLRLFHFRDRDQGQREEAIKHFRQKDTPILVATDVCARGIDIKDMDHVS